MMIPAVALERGEQAFVRVLRRRFPDAAFLVHEAAIGPEDADAPGQVGAGAAADLHAGQEAGQNLATLRGRESGPKRRKRPSGRNPGEAGG